MLCQLVLVRHLFLYDHVFFLFLSRKLGTEQFRAMEYMFVQKFELLCQLVLVRHLFWYDHVFFDS